MEVRGRGHQTRPRTVMAAKRLELYVTQGEIAEACGVTVPLIAFIEKRTQRCANDRNRQRIAKMLRLPVADVFDDRGWALPLPGERAERYVPPSRLPASVSRRIVALAKQGWTKADIAADVGVTGYQVWKSLTHAGLVTDYRGRTVESYGEVTGRARRSRA